MKDNYITPAEGGQEKGLLEAIDELLDKKFMPKRRDNERLAAYMDEVKQDFKDAKMKLYDDIIEQRCKEKGWDPYHVWWRYCKLMSRRAQGLHSCGTYLEFGWHRENNKTRLHYANFCKGRICPMCGWRRSLKLYGQLSKIVDCLVDEGRYSFVFMTLTVKNVPMERLSGCIDEMMAAFRKLFQRKTLPSSQGKKGLPNPVFELSKGFFRSLEITVNEKGECHPHFHVLIAVDRDYYTSDKFLKTEELAQVWKAFLGVDYTPVVDLRAPKVYGKMEACDYDLEDKAVLKKAVSEVAKYTVKSNDIVRRLPDKDAVKRCLFGLDFALRSRRLVAFAGVFDEWHSKLAMSDAEELDDTDIMNRTVADLIIRCEWKGTGWVKEIVVPDDEEPFV